jgi:hypothetical protein
MRLRLPLLVISAAASLVFASSAFAAAVTDRASLTRHGKVAFGKPISAKVNVHTRFASIKRVCFAFAFEDDLLDPGEAWSLRSNANVKGFEMGNAGVNQIIGVEFCLLPDHWSLINRFRDGRAKLIVAMDTPGSMRIDELDVTVRGVRR